MKEKEFKRLVDMANCLVDDCSENESALAICCNDEGKFYYANYCSVNDVAAAVATILSDYHDDKNEKADTIARGIVKGIAVYIAHEGKGGLPIAAEIAQACHKVLEKKKENIKDMLENIIKDVKGDDDDDDVDDNGEDCGECGGMKDCPLPQAVKYRKENHIPAPKKNKHGKKSKDEKGN